MALFQPKGTLRLVDAVRLPGDAWLPVAGGDWVDAKRGDWLLTDSDNDQSVLADAVFREQYEPVSAEAVRLLAEPLEGDDEEDDA